MKIPLGARVRYTVAIYRIEHEHEHGHHWQKEPLDRPAEGIFMGYRYKQDGSWEREYEEYSTWGSSGGASYWCESGRVKVALIVTDPWADPWFADPDSLEIVHEREAAISQG